MMIGVADRSMRSRCLAIMLGVSMGVLSSGCTLPTDVDDRPTSIRITTGDVQAFAFGEFLLIEAEVKDTRGRTLGTAGIHWELSEPGVLEHLQDGYFRVVGEGSVHVAAVARRAPSVRAAVTVSVNASFVSRSCIIRFDQVAAGDRSVCAEKVSRVHSLDAPTDIVRLPAYIGPDLSVFRTDPRG